MNPKYRSLLKASPAIAALLVLQAIALVAVFAALQVLAPSLGDLRAYAEEDLPNLLLGLGALVGLTYVIKNL